MNKMRLPLIIAGLLASTSVYAQTIEFINGDTLDVELIQQTMSTITFSHPVLGKQTIDKAKISNLQDLDLNTLVKVAGGAEGQAIEVVKVTEEKVLLAKQELDVAKKKVLTAEVNVKTATDSEVEEREQQLVDATEEHTAAEEKLITAVDDVNAAEKKVIVAREVKVASEQVKVAKSEARKAKENVRLAEKEIKVAKENVNIAEKSVEVADEASVSMAEVDVEHAEKQVSLAEDMLEIAEDGAEEAKEKITVAENQVKLAKGEKVPDGFMGTGWFTGWDSSVSLGLSGASGTSVNSTFRAAFDTRYEDDKHRWDFKSFYFFDSEDNVAGENQVNATLTKDWFFKGSKWFAFATTVYDWDQFSDWNHRLQIGGGPGYQFIKTKTWEFSGRMGLTAIFEFGKTQFDSNGDPMLEPDGSESEENIVGLEGLLGADVTWHISAKQRFTLSNYFYPGFTDAGQYRNLTNLAWIHDIEWFEGLAIKFGIRNEYDTSESIPNEFKYNFSLLWGF